MPSGITQVEKKAVFDACLQVGIHDIHLIEEPMAAAIGANLPIEMPLGNMVVDIGGGTTEVAVITLAANAYSESLRVAGDELDEAIVRHLQRKYQVAIGLNAAEKIKIADRLGPRNRSTPALSHVIGKDMVNGIPKNLTVASQDVREAIEEPVAAIVDAVKRAIEKTPAGAGLRSTGIGRDPNRRRARCSRGSTRGSRRRRASRSRCRRTP